MSITETIQPASLDATTDHFLHNLAAQGGPPLYALSNAVDKGSFPLGRSRQSQRRDTFCGCPALLSSAAPCPARG
jgi:hypothetical protein